MYKKVDKISSVIYKALFASVLALSLYSAPLKAEQEHPPVLEEVDGLEAEKTDFDIAYLIESKITDAHQWHIVDIGDRKVYLYLPVILINNHNGWTPSIFLSNRFDHGKEVVQRGDAHYTLHKGTVYITDAEGTITYDAEGNITNAAPIDISITKNVLAIFIVILIMCLIFMSVAKSYKQRAGMAPKGLQSFMEPIILFVRDEVAKNNIGEKKYRKFLPYLLTLFFFILINNLLGLVPIFPGKANVTGNISVTLTLAACTLVITNFNGTKAYWGHIFWPPGMPVPIKILMAVVELIGVLIKPFALMIRLFANMTAGHILMMSIFGLIFLLAPAMGTGGALGLSVGTVLFAVFMNLLKLIVAFLQAFIFTLLSAIFIGQAVDEGHH